MTISTTTNLGLKKPVLGTAEDADITTINDNMDTLDAAVGAVDVSTDGSLQEQINDLGESVSFEGSSASVKFDMWSTGFQVGAYTDNVHDNGFMVNFEKSSKKVVFYQIINGAISSVFSIQGQ